MNKQLKSEEVEEQNLKFKTNDKKIVSNAECGPTPPGEVVIRSAYCNLRCIPCFAYGYSWPEKAKENKNIVEVPVIKLISEFNSFIINSPIPGNEKSYNWFRILGDEPFLNKQTLIRYTEFLRSISNDLSPKFSNSILIQTNGIASGRINKEELVRIFSVLKDKPFRVVIEISIKGSNSEEFRIITQSPEELYKLQINACKSMEYVNSKIANVTWTAVAGFGIGVLNLVSGDLNRKEYIKTFYHPATNKPFYHPDCWDSFFKQIYELHIKKYQHIFGNKFPTFGIEDRSNWKFALWGLKNCKRIAHSYFYDGYEVYKKGSTRNDELEKHIEKMFEKFFFGDPTKYYKGLFM